MANIGYVGLGTMGGQMANRFLEKGHNVTGYNRTRSKAEWLIDKGLKFADSPRAVAATTDVVLSMVTNSEALSRIAEGPVLAEKSGIPPEIAVEVLLNSVAASAMLQYRGPFVLKMPEEAWFNVNMMQKDMQLALELGRQVQVPLPTTALAN